MGCLDKVGGTIIAIIVIIVGISIITGGEVRNGISCIIGGVIFGILTFAVDSDDYASIVDSIMESEFSLIMTKIFINGLISGCVAFFLSRLIGFFV